MSSYSSLSAAADERKARLAKLASLKRKQPEDDHPPSQDQQPEQSAAESKQEGDSSQASDPVLQHLSLRNYDPVTRGPKLGFEAPPTENLNTLTLEEKAAALEAEARRKAQEEQEAAAQARGLDITTLQPKKPNWDLKREFKQRMAVLDVRTENAIARMVRERLAEKKKATVGASAAASGAADGAASGGGNNGKGEEGVLEGAEILEGMRMREKEEEEEARREKEAEEAEFGTA